jgi:hypothetical protein
VPPSPSPPADADADANANADADVNVEGRLNLDSRCSVVPRRSRRALDPVVAD